MIKFGFNSVAVSTAIKGGYGALKTLTVSTGNFYIL
jgi:hypothetical protein